MIKFKITALLFIFCLVLQANSDGIYDAVNSAADKTVNQMTAAGGTSGIKNIAFLGFKNDRNQFTPEFRAALSSHPGRFSFIPEMKVNLIV